MTRRAVVAAAAAATSFADAAGTAHAGIFPEDEPQPLDGPRPDAATIEAWQARKFAMFIHFGLYSLLGGMWKGKRIDNGYSEQILANGHLPPKAYAALARRFDPVNFDPDGIAELALAAGMKSIVITAKHHDGFNLFRTAETGYNMVDATPYGKDVVALMAAACACHGLKFGVYYSTIDWHRPGGNAYLPGNSNPITRAQEEFNLAQIKELMRGYGPIGEFWFDMGLPTPRQSSNFARAVHDIQPQTMVSGRVWNYQGDFAVMGDNDASSVTIEEPWEAPASIFSDTWGYRSWQLRDDLPGKIKEHVTRLARVASRGGNYILNIGPKEDGSVVPFEAEVLKGVGAWMKVNGEAIHDTKAQPFMSLDFGCATLKPGVLYLFVETMPQDGILRLPGLVDSTLVDAHILGSDGAVSVSVDPDGARIDTAGTASLRSGALLPVIAVRFQGDLHVRPAAISPGHTGRVRLAASAASRFFNYNGHGYAAEQTIYKLAWYAALSTGKYRAEIYYNPLSTARKVDLLVDGVRMRVTLPVDGRAAVYVQRNMATQPYAMKVEIMPAEPFERGDTLPVGIRHIDLVPLAD